MTAVPTSPFPASTVLGYPRIGPRRELKRALEAYWQGRLGVEGLREAGARLREGTWLRLAELGLAALPSNTFSLYDHVLDAAMMVDAVPGRYRRPLPEDTCFAMARGGEGAAPLRMTKWFDTNYHYLVPQVGPGTRFRAVPGKPVGEVREARALGLSTRPVLLGPVTFLLLCQAEPGAAEGFRPLERLDDLLAVYEQVLGALAAEGVAWVQLDEPALVADRSPGELAAVGEAYRRLGGLRGRPGLLVAGYFGELGAALPVLAGTPVEAIGLDLVRGGGDLAAACALPELAGKTVVAGVVGGRDVWRTDQERALAGLLALRARAGRVVVSTSCSLLHLPYDVDAEDGLPAGLRERLAFAEQKVAEVVELAGRLAAVPVDAPVPGVPVLAAGAGVPDAGRGAAGPWPASGRAPYEVRAAAQAARLRLPALPVTTIGSFPQTGELRAARAAFSAGELGAGEYEERVRGEIRRVVELQERLGLDVLVHGEPERNDMVQYFAEHLEGFAVTRHGWVQSYGSRCVRPPILYGEVRRRGPVTVGWTRYAQSLTDRPVKGMLTGPVTIAAWSFVRDDVPLPRVVGQIAEAVREEVADLEAAGVAIVQVDEPALRELMPLRAAGRAEYLAWAVGAYRRATSGAGERTQIHTHLCYSEASEIVEAIDALDADVTSVESARSQGRLPAEPGVAGFGRGLGPGVYDIHSPRVPGVAEVAGGIEAVLRVLPVERVWVNPDCGLKTRTYEQVEAALANMVAAARLVRERLL
ncbi:5-methyltetrahydropteroyltriglutamate--homocysteine methyltransferase [Sphaerisporangium melleum]|uniref:5-methyltetrahydropteroyltriglutamate--homocysteine S-methyltransferase n=1 Tax=Sphaerisporangium melleum TaxID=321316 RepID=A0A917VN91_9ACTN|nr:5-methyltetrahydropteroyltriglutamate--homocysteine S-methyltransferase [Sphaerisporangium melleum]GGL02155.1 5-methyltetrahydropteroyltriglutamate--homocysteine methyltransferase [Sphaerisporangium melleum]GII72218.1 5-methyltetrahydropteroyltriglutamate--homocysteine methyltransferase [Sphaerisporangium melleum]